MLQFNGGTSTFRMSLWGGVLLRIVVQQHTRLYVCRQQVSKVMPDFTHTHIL